MQINKEIEFNNIVNDILKNKDFIELKYEMHHGITRLDHSLNVAHITFSMCKSLNLKNTAEVTRAALLHDFFKSNEVTKNSFVNHPMIALKNAQANFELTEMQENIIASHMFPACKILPKYKESWLVSIADKIISLKECLAYKVPLKVEALFIFLINFIIIPR